MNFFDAKSPLSLRFREGNPKAIAQQAFPVFKSRFCVPNAKKSRPVSRAARVLFFIGRVGAADVAINAS